jgi:hypothetical protein
MVLDAKALAWAAEHNIDTAKLKAAKVPIYGKWYFPEIPAGVPLISLQTGERCTFGERMIAGEVIWVAEADLERAGLLPGGEEGGAPREAPAAEEPPPAPVPRRVLATAVEETPEPFLAMSRPPGLEFHTPPTTDMQALEEATTTDQAPPAGIHLPSPSIGPFVLGVGFCLTLLGVITHPLIVVVGLLWMLAGAIVWIRVGLLEERAAQAHAHASEHDPETAP